MSEQKNIPLPYTRVTMTVEQTHHCGQVIQEVTTLRVDAGFSLAVSHDPPFSITPEEFSDSDHERTTLAQVMEQERHRKMLVYLHGTVEGVVVMGCAFVEGKGLRCLTCGANMLFPDDTPTQAPAPTFHQWDAPKEDDEEEAVWATGSQS